MRTENFMSVPVSASFTRVVTCLWRTGRLPSEARKRYLLATDDDDLDAFDLVSEALGQLFDDWFTLIADGRNPFATPKVPFANAGALFNHVLETWLTTVESGRPDPCRVEATH